jgi:radical SAM superfamily enzyme YgiQ (UPF0313 family)
VGGIIERCGHKAKIFDLYLESVDSLRKTIKEFNPSVIGFGGIATSYGMTKQLSLDLKEHFPDILQIAGGPLASTYEFLLTKSKIDVVFHGETEISLPIFLKLLEKSEPFHDVPGISYLSNGRVVRNAAPEQIKNLDEVPLPAYHLVDVKRYLSSVKDYLDTFSLVLRDPRYSDVIKRVGNRTHYIPITSSRGCTHRCFFCYRHVFGHRQHSVKYVVEHIKYLQKTYGVYGFQFCDELFNADTKWVMDFCDAIERENLDIFYLINGARVDKVDEKMLARLKQTGCIEIEYGHESGSDVVLKEYRKGISSARNREVSKLTQNAGLLMPVPIVIGSPSETDETVGETIQFLKDINALQYSLNYLIPLPETPSWQYVMERNLIKDVEKYLDDVAEYGGTRLLVNLTKEPSNVVRSWAEKISYEMTKHYYKTTNRLGLYSLYSLFGKARIHFGPFIPHAVKKSISRLFGIYQIKL